MLGWKSIVVFCVVCLLANAETTVEVLQATKMPFFVSQGDSVDSCSKGSRVNGICCPSPGGIFTHCPHDNGVCCPDAGFCCPASYTCRLAHGKPSCVKPIMVVPSMNSAMGGSASPSSELCLSTGGCPTMVNKLHSNPCTVNEVDCSRTPYVQPSMTDNKAPSAGNKYVTIDTLPDGTVRRTITETLNDQAPPQTPPPIPPQQQQPDDSSASSSASPSIDMPAPVTQQQQQTAENSSSPSVGFTDELAKQFEVAQQKLRNQLKKSFQELKNKLVSKTKKVSKAIKKAKKKSIKQKKSKKKKKVKKEIKAAKKAFYAADASARDPLKVPKIPKSALKGAESLPKSMFARKRGRRGRKSDKKRKLQKQKKKKKKQKLNKKGIPKGNHFSEPIPKASTDGAHHKHAVPTSRRRKKTRRRRQRRSKSPRFQEKGNFLSSIVKKEVGKELKQGALKAKNKIANKVKGVFNKKKLKNPFKEDPVVAGTVAANSRAPSVNPVPNANLNLKHQPKGNPFKEDPKWKKKFNRVSMKNPAKKKKGPSKCERDCNNHCRKKHFKNCSTRCLTFCTTNQKMSKAKKRRIRKKLTGLPKSARKLMQKQKTCEVVNQSCGCPVTTNCCGRACCRSCQKKKKKRSLPPPQPLPQNCCQAGKKKCKSNPCGARHHVKLNAQTSIIVGRDPCDPIKKCRSRKTDYN